MLLNNKFAMISEATTENVIGYATAPLFIEHGATIDVKSGISIPA